jgi:hypothetical protein
MYVPHGMLRASETAVQATVHLCGRGALVKVMQLLDACSVSTAGCLPNGRADNLLLFLFFDGNQLANVVC